MALGLYDLAELVFLRIEGTVKRGEVECQTSLPAAGQEEIDEAVAMLMEASAQGHAGASVSLGFLLEEVRKDSKGAEATCARRSRWIRGAPPRTITSASC